MAERFLGADQIHSPRHCTRQLHQLRRRAPGARRTLHNPFFGLTSRGGTTYDLHRLLLNADLQSAISSGLSYNLAVTWLPRRACRRRRC